MPIRIAIASGKGGTGKTTVASRLYSYFSSETSSGVMLVDCDVEEPNAALFFPDAEKKEEKKVYQEIPVINGDKCNYCRKCTAYCEFNAILVMPPVKFAEINPSLCHSCGACEVACQEDAIEIRQHQIGVLNKYNTSSGGGIREGLLDIGSAMQTMVIRERLKSLSPDNRIIILDAPPGTSCPVVETISGTDYVVLVSEPTPFGLYDLGLMVDLVREMSLPFGVVINKAGLGDRKIYDYLEKEDIPLLGEIPFEESYARAYAEGKLFHDAPDSIEKAYQSLSEKLIQTLSL